jgi:hypothetical protein
MIPYGNLVYNCEYILYVVEAACRIEQTDAVAATLLRQMIGTLEKRLREQMTNHLCWSSGWAESITSGEIPAPTTAAATKRGSHDQFRRGDWLWPRAEAGTVVTIKEKSYLVVYNKVHGGYGLYIVKPVD